jgi:hypothetical protein
MNDLGSFFSTSAGPLGARVERYVREHELVWRAVPAEPLPPGKRYTRVEKKSVERELANLIGRLSSEPARASFLDGSLDPARAEELAAELRPVFKRLLRLVDLPLEEVYDARFLDSTRRFLQAARDFDPGLSIDSAYQALRNVWIMNSLQFDLGLPVEHTDAVFAYSMVYPYLDNVLDDVGTTEGEKLALVAKLKAWLEGTERGADSPREQKLRDLVAIIERRYSRPDFPGVYQSLLAIYNAQVKSLLQQRAAAAPSPEDILAISLEKGGTSVLADGYLVAGRLKPADEDFCFGFGTFLQLADDLQDIAEDARCGHRTLFSRRTGRAPLDGQAVKLGRYLAAVLDRARPGATASRSALCDAIGSGLSLMFLESVGKNPAYFSRGFVRRSKKSFPARFSYLRKLRRRLGGQLPLGPQCLSDLDPGLVALMALSSRAFSLD